MIRHMLVATALVAVSASAAGASTLPPLDFRANQVMLGLGALDANVDVALSDRFSVGLSAQPFSPVTGRATVRVGEVGGLSYGLSLAGGLTPNVWGSVSGPTTYSTWVQPALVVGYRFGGPEGALSLRGTVGPMFLNGSTAMPFLAWPNAEVAYRFAPGHELTLGGNGLVGWRGTF